VEVERFAKRLARRLDIERRCAGVDERLVRRAAFSKQA